MPVLVFCHNQMSESPLKRKEGCCLFSSCYCSHESSIHSATDGGSDENAKEGRAGMRAGE